MQQHIFLICCIALQAVLFRLVSSCTSRALCCIAGSAVHASQQLQKQGSVPYINNHTPSHHVAGSRLKAAMEMSGERISGPVDVPTSSSDASGFAGDETLGGENDDVELEKSNILMLGPTGATCSLCI